MTKKKVTKKRAAKKVTEPTQLVPIENVNALQLFDKEGKFLDGMLVGIRTEAMSFVPDLSTVDGRKFIAATAYNVARSKTTIDKAGKDLVAEQKAAIKEIDNRRKHSREYLDELRDEVRKPLTDWEAEQEKIAQAEADADKLVADEEEAYALHELWLREEKVKAQEARIAELEEKERLRLAEEETREREEKAREDERERVRLESAEKIREAEDRAATAEREAEERAENARREAEQKAADEAEHERRRLAGIEEARAAGDKARADDLEHQRKINNEIVAAFMEHGFNHEQAIDVATLVITGKIPHMQVNY